MIITYTVRSRTNTSAAEQQHRRCWLLNQMHWRKWCEEELANIFDIQSLDLCWYQTVICPVHVEVFHQLNFRLKNNICCIFWRIDKVSGSLVSLRDGVNIKVAKIKLNKFFLNKKFNTILSKKNNLHIQVKGTIGTTKSCDNLFDLKTKLFWKKKNFSDLAD